MSTGEAAVWYGIIGFAIIIAKEIAYGIYEDIDRWWYGDGRKNWWEGAREGVRETVTIVFVCFVLWVMFFVWAFLL